MKRISFKVAKAIKKAEYPQGKTDKIYLLSPLEEDLAYREFGLLPLNGDYKIGEMLPSARYSKYGIKTCDTPTYLDVWLWLWREKNIQITIGVDFCCIWIPDKNGNYMSKTTIKKDGPEEAIVAAVDYLVDNNLIE